jgi:threonine synthase
MAEESRVFWLECPQCGRTYEPGPCWYGCETCRDPAGHAYWLEVRYDLARIDPTFLFHAGRVWDYAPLLPLRDLAQVRTLGEGGTPLVRIEALNRAIGMPNLYLKLEPVNPTGSFKDRLHTVTMNVARELGVSRAAIITTGNSGVACAAYAARNNISLLIITDPQSSPEQRRLMRLFGAQITAPQQSGSVMLNARRLIETLVREHGFAPCTVLGTYNGPGNPYGVEGYKTIAFEVFGQLGRAPDRMCVPVSGGDALYGPFKAFREMREMGVIERLPRVVACQPAGANFIVRAIRENLDALPVIEPHTFALSIGDPTGSHCILEAIRASGGDAWDATDPELLEMVALLGRHGICIEGASAAPVAALRKQAASGALDPEECIVAVLTGSGMKWLAQLDAAIGAAPPLLPDDVPTLLRALALEEKQATA